VVIASAVLRALVALPRRAGAYPFGVVFGVPDERLRGNHPDCGGGPGDRTTERADLQSGDAERRALATPWMTGGTTS
jgi:hypothetical protein